MLKMKGVIGEMALELRTKLTPHSEENKDYIQKVILSKNGLPSDREQKDFKDKVNILTQ